MSDDPLGSFLMAIAILIGITVGIGLVVAFIVTYWLPIVVVIGAVLVVWGVCLFTRDGQATRRQTLAYKRALYQKVQQGERVHQEIEWAYRQAQAEMDRLDRQWAPMPYIEGEWEERR